ncbi:MAG: SDR family oxidoreductase [Ruminococcaceae bacterium]|nr:SDR family oxidoreductase [Oscillospiraceae bacterium]
MRRKVALITGGARGIGRQIVISMAKAGYDVAVNYHGHFEMAQDVCRIAQESGAKALPFYADMGSVKNIRRMYDEVTSAFGTLDVVVNNAGISSEVYFLDATEQDFDTMTAVDWKGVYFSSQCAARYMIEHNIKGIIINVSSNQVDGCWPRATIYAPTKAAVTKFTRNAGMELSRMGIRMAAIAPGYTDVGWESGDIRLEAAERLPLKRFATTEEVAQGVLYLASENAGYIIGSTLTIDGGATLPVVAANDFV